jgi:eukaryotic-like serine/threonine-protein kinase
MFLPPGARLGPYEVVGAGGPGGAGGVYHAKDTRADRLVALKVLPATGRGEDERHEHLAAVLRVGSTLDHPHIRALKDAGCHGAVDYLVMEPVEGETLAARLEEGPLPTEELIRYGIQIADAMEKAHHRRIVHGGLVPANVILTKAGVKLQGFGLAELLDTSTATPGSPASESGAPESTGGALEEATAYMAPEQLEGNRADARTDVFALGAILYEMATGKRAFAGTDVSGFAASRPDPPPIATAKPMSPPALDRLVRVCLAKDPDRRLQTARDVMQELKWIAVADAQGEATTHTAMRGQGYERLLWAGVTVALLGGLLYTSGAFRSQPGFGKRVRFRVVPEGQGMLSDAGIALSPNGQQLAFVATDEEGRTTLWIRSIDAVAPRPLPGAEGAVSPFWSPDNRSIGFFADSALKRIDLAGGPARVLAEVHQGLGGTWNRDGVIVYAPGASTGLWTVPASGGSAAPLTRPDVSRSEADHGWPQFLPDGRRYLYVVWSGPARGADLYLGSLDSKQAKKLVPGAGRSLYSTTGHLLFARGGQLLAQRFDRGRREVEGEPSPVVEDFSPGSGGPYGFTAFSVSDEGTLAYRTAGDAASRGAVEVCLNWAADLGR